MLCVDRHLEDDLLQTPRDVWGCYFLWTDFAVVHHQGLHVNGFCNHDLICGAISSYQVCGLVIYYVWVSVSSSEKWGIQHLSLLTLGGSSSLFFLGSPFFRSSASLWLYSKWLKINPPISPTFLTWLIVSTFLHSISLMPDRGSPDITPSAPVSEASL